MSSLIPFRAWKFANGDTTPIEILKNPERKFDDRSPFVRYARSAALWAEWIREGTVVQASDPSLPIVENDGVIYHLGIAAIDSLNPMMSVIPAAKEHIQRLLEGVQLYPDPIVVIRTTEGEYSVVGNHELYEAAKSYRDEVSRPGKIRASDHCLVAVVDEKYLSTLTTTPLTFPTNKDESAIESDLLSLGYVLSPRADDPSNFMVVLGDKIFARTVEPGLLWKRQLSEAIGVKSLDMASKNLSPEANSSGKKIVLTFPKVTRIIAETKTEYPYGSIATKILPPSGAMMWNLRDF